MTACHYGCGSTDKADLRPYGPDRQMVCYDCAMSPEHVATTHSAIAEELRVAEADVADDPDRVLALTTHGWKAMTLEELSQALASVLSVTPRKEGGE